MFSYLRKNVYVLRIEKISLLFSFILDMKMTQNILFGITNIIVTITSKSLNYFPNYQNLRTYFRVQVLINNLFFFPFQLWDRLKAKVRK